MRTSWTCIAEAPPIPGQCHTWATLHLGHPASAPPPPCEPSLSPFQHPPFTCLSGKSQQGGPTYSHASLAGVDKVARQQAAGFSITVTMGPPSPVYPVRYPGAKMSTLDAPVPSYAPQCLLQGDKSMDTRHTHAFPWGARSRLHQGEHAMQAGIMAMGMLAPSIICCILSGA